MRPTMWNRGRATPLVVCVVGIVVAAIIHPALAQRSTGDATPAVATQDARPQVQSQSPDDEANQARQALQAAAAELQAAQEKYVKTKALNDRAEAARERAKKAKIAMRGADLRRQVQSLRWRVSPGHDEKTIIVTPVGSVRPNADLGFDVAVLSLELPLAKDFKVWMGGKEVKWPLENPGDVVFRLFGTPASLRLADDLPEVTRIDIDAPNQVPVLKAVDAAKGTISLAVGETATLENIPAADAQIVIGDRKIGLESLKPGTRVAVELVVRDGLILAARIAEPPKH